MEGQDKSSRAQFMLPFREKMREGKITGRWLAKKMDVSPSYISGLLSGAKNPTIDKLLCLADILGLVLAVSLKGRHD